MFSKRNLHSSYFDSNTLGDLKTDEKKSNEGRTHDHEARPIDPTVNILAKKLKKGGFLETLSGKMGIDVKETSPFVDYKKETK